MENGYYINKSFEDCFKKSSSYTINAPKGSYIELTDDDIEGVLDKDDSDDIAIGDYYKTKK